MESLKQTQSFIGFVKCFWNFAWIFSITLWTPCLEATILLLICGLIFFSYFLRPDFTRKSRTSNWLCTRLSQALSRLDFWKKGTQSDLIIFHYTLHPYVLLLSPPLLFLTPLFPVVFGSIPIISVKHQCRQQSTVATSAVSQKNYLI